MNRRKCKLVALAASISGVLLLFALAKIFLHSEGGLSIGEAIPSAVLHSSDGFETDTRSWRGSSTVLLLFRSSCPACRKQIESLEVIAADFPQLRIVLLSLSGDPPLEKVAFTVCFDHKGEFVRKVRRLRVPTLYWIDPNGSVKYVRTGCREAASDVSLFRSLLGEDTALTPLPFPRVQGANMNLQFVRQDKDAGNKNIPLHKCSE
jgi:peroxiredoxin